MVQLPGGGGRAAQRLPTTQPAGFTLFFTGLSGSGKSTLAKIIYGKLVEGGRRPATLLDGDIVRQNLSSELGFPSSIVTSISGASAMSPARSRRTGHCDLRANCAVPRDPPRSARDDRGTRGLYRDFVATPLDVCESRDRKGLYAKARKG